MPSMLKRLGVPILVALAVGSFCTATAWASDTFTLVNNSTWALGGTWFGYMPPCTGGAFSNEPYAIAKGQSASITLSRGAFTSCDGSISISGYDSANGATWYFNPDDPTVGPASIASCYAEPSLASIVVFSINGLTCTASDPPSVPVASVVASTAALRGDDAFIPVQFFAKKPISGHARIDVVVRDLKGRLRGRGVQTIGVGWPRVVQVPVDRALRQQVAKQKQVNVLVTVRRIDGKPGNGDHLRLILQADRSTLPY